MDLIRLFLAN